MAGQTPTALQRRLVAPQAPGGEAWMRWAIMTAVLIIGMAVRLSVWRYTTTDTTAFLLPWYQFAQAHGWAGLKVAFTNYAPFYSYLLVLITRLDGLAPPLLLIKSLSVAFELGTAVLAYRIVVSQTQAPWRAVWAFTATWLAPTVLYNGALWGQADAIWTFFLLLAVSSFLKGGNGVLAFAMAIAVKAQGVFLGPFVLGLMLRQRRALWWFAAIPAVYLIVALPVFIAGRPVMDVLEVYGRQSTTFHALSMNAASLWALLPHVPYDAGVVAGLILASIAGAGLAAVIARAEPKGEFDVLAACLSLLAMPFLLPKMHDRYFYAFEMTSIILACLNPRYAIIAVVAQVDAVFSYIGFDRQIILGVGVAAMQNLGLLVFLACRVIKAGPMNAPKGGDVLRYASLLVALCGALFWIGLAPTRPEPALLFRVLASLLVIQLSVMLYRMISTRAGAPRLQASSARAPSNR